MSIPYRTWNTGFIGISDYDVSCIYGLSKLENRKQKIIKYNGYHILIVIAIFYIYRCDEVCFSTVGLIKKCNNVSIYLEYAKHFCTALYKCNKFINFGVTCYKLSSFVFLVVGSSYPSSFWKIDFSFNYASLINRSK